MRSLEGPVLFDPVTTVVTDYRGTPHWKDSRAMGTQTTLSWRQERSFVVPATRLSSICQKSVKPMSQHVDFAYPANERRDLLGRSPVMSST